MGFAFFIFFKNLKPKVKRKGQNQKRSAKQQTPIFSNTLTERLVNGLCWQVFWLGFVGLLDDRSSSLVKAKILL